MAAFTLTQSEEDLSIFLVVGPDGRPVSTINAFLLHLSHCGRSAYTLRSYARGLAHFFGWLHTTGRQVDDVTPQAVEAYIALFSTETKGGACPVDPHKAGQINIRTRKSAPSVHRQPRSLVLCVLHPAGYGTWLGTLDTSSQSRSSESIRQHECAWDAWSRRTQAREAS